MSDVVFLCELNLVRGEIGKNEIEVQLVPMHPMGLRSFLFDIVEWCDAGFIFEDAVKAAL